MTQNEASEKAAELWQEWVSARPAIGYNGYLQESSDMNEYRFYDLSVIHRSMLQEYRWTLKNPARMTVECFSELKGKLVLLGKVRKALRGEPR